jgi:3-hydroxyisobutyrate dehydrogenase-like beta-hydroxyacid dehydrogenase
MKIAFLGLGIMGSRMAANLARAGHELSVWNRTPARATEFCQRHSARAASTPAQSAATADIVVTMVVDGPQVRQVLLGDDGAAAGAPPGALFVDCSTIGVQATLEIARELAERGMSMVDAPVTGSSPRAEDGTLTIMAGGSEADFERARPVLEATGKVIVHAGPLGHGQMVKLINNAVAASNAAVLAQALLVAKRAGVDLDALIEVMAAGSGASTMLSIKAGPMREHDYTTLFKLERSDSGDEVEVIQPFFKLEHMLKDVALCLDEGEAIGAPFPMAALAKEIMVAAMAQGHGEHDFSSMIEVMEAAASIKL